MELSTIPSQLLPLGCMRDYGSSTVQVHGGLRDRDKARRRSTPVSRVDMTKRSSAARCLSSPVSSHLSHPRRMTSRHHPSSCHDCVARLGRGICCALPCFCLVLLAPARLCLVHHRSLTTSTMMPRPSTNNRPSRYPCFSLRLFAESPPL